MINEDHVKHNLVDRDDPLQDHVFQYEAEFARNKSRLQSKGRMLSDERQKSINVYDARVHRYQDNTKRQLMFDRESDRVPQYGKYGKFLAY